MADNVGVRPSTTTGSLNIVVDPVTEDGVLTHYPKYKSTFGPDGISPTTVDEDNPLPATIAQSVVASTSNNSTANLAAGAEYIGTGESTLNVIGLQFMVYADQPLTIIIEQADTDTWTEGRHIHDTFTFTLGQDPLGFTVQAISSYFRIRVTNNGPETTTFFNAQSVLCPIAEPLPRSLDTTTGALKVHAYAGKDIQGAPALNSFLGEQRVAEVHRLTGSAFAGEVLDDKFWTSTVANSATITQTTGQVHLQSGTNAAGSAILNTVHHGRAIAAVSNIFQGIIQLDAGIADNTRRWGIVEGDSLPTFTDGAYFELVGTTFCINTMIGGSATTVASGSFNGGVNGVTGGTYTPDTNAAVYEIVPLAHIVHFIINGLVVHTVFAGAATWTNSLNFHVYLSNVNSGNTTDVDLHTRGAVIKRLGKATSEPVSYYINGTAATHTLKLGPGILHKIVFNNTSGTRLEIYDGVTAVNPRGLITTTASAIGPWSYDLPFEDGLVLVTIGNSLDATVMYE